MKRYVVTTGTSLSQRSRCWFLPNFDGNNPKKRSPPGLPDGYSDTADTWRSVYECMDDASLSDSQRIEFLKEEPNRSRRYRIQASECPITASQSSEEAMKAATLEVEKHFDIACWSRNKRHLLPAELATLLLMHEEGVFPEPSTGREKCEDTIHFFGGRTNMAETVLCCAALQRIARERADFRISDESISCSYDRDLEPRSIDFIDTVHNWMNEYFNKTKAKPEFVLTGGYKGVAIAMAMRLRRDVGATRVFYLHEDEDRELIVMDVPSNET